MDHIRSVELPQSGDCIRAVSSSVVAVGCSGLDGNTWDGRLCIVNAETGVTRKVVRTYAGTSALDVIKSGDKPLLISGGDDGAVYCWDLNALGAADDDKAQGSSKFSDKKKKKRRKKAQDAPSTETGGQAREPDTPMFNMYDHQDVVSAISSKTGQHLLSASWDCTVKLWNLKAPAWPITTFSAHTKEVYDVQWAPGTGDEFASASRDKRILYWDARVAAGAPVRGTAFDSPVHVLRFNPHNPLQVAAGFEDGSVCVLDARSTAAPLAEHRSGKLMVRDLQYSPHTAGLLAAVGDDQCTRLLQHTSEGLLEHSRSQPHADYGHSICWLGNDQGPTLASVGRRGFMHVSRAT